MPGEFDAADVEIRPTNILVEKAGKTTFDVASGDTSGSSILQHKIPIAPTEKSQGTKLLDRSIKLFKLLMSLISDD
ncbi:hypothetical protein PENCOP_c001G06746 [Penicillium coprophilum]|uniref:Uncharacterized protein n=1 Tax=Penicillium coprophilum TaxID=36646 RepID=A0A1V6V5I7_9EURO|nr:hypothetical protein PENCOP_c001G06746 [Penicillium coprophilum]